MRPDLLQSIRLDAGERAGFISDLHIGPQDPAIERRFADYLASSAGRLDALFILGDLFEFWIGDDAAGLCGHLDTVQTLAAFLERSGCRGYLMHGNRDFLIGERFCRETGCQLLTDPCILEHAGTRILLSHGDGYCTDDVEHQRFRSMVRDPEWQEAFLNRSQSDRLDYALEARARSESGKSTKSMDIMDVNASAITEAMRRHGVRHMIHGHTHRPAIHTTTVDGEEAFRVVLGAWFDQQNWLTVTRGELRYAFGGGEQVLPLGAY